MREQIWASPEGETCLVMSEVHSFGFTVCLKLVDLQEGKTTGFSQVEELGVEVALSKEVNRVKCTAGPDPAIACKYLYTTRDHKLIVWFV